MGGTPAKARVRAHHRNVAHGRDRLDLSLWDGTFRFPDEPSPESGPYPSPFYSESPGAGHEKPLEVTRLGPFMPDLRLEEELAAGLDVFSYGGGSGAVFENLRFTSSRNGGTLLQCL